MAETVKESTKQYLLTFLSNDEAALAEISAQVVEAKMTIQKEESLGKRSLAFPIRHENELNLFSIFFQASPDQIKELKSKLDLSQKVYRYLLTDWEGDIENKRLNQRKRAAHV